MIVDLGTGDGRAVLARAAAEPTAFVIGIDANAAGMAASSRRASRGRGRLPNACFLVAAAEALPGPFGGAAHLVTVTMPWGSLLRGILGLDDRVLRGVASIVAAGGRVEVLVSVERDDRFAGFETLDVGSEPAIATAWSAVGFDLTSMRPASGDELMATHSSWGRRLGKRAVWRLALDRRIDVPRRSVGRSRAWAQDGGH